MNRKQDNIEYNNEKEEVTNKIKKIAFFNPQGNFDKYDSHLTEHPDFGGQLVYVKELAKAIASKGIEVDIITRQIVDDGWQEFSELFDYYPDAPNVRIVRIPFGGNKFLRKEDLWPFLPDYVEKIIKLYENEGKLPDFVTTHYGDGGISGVMFLAKTGTPFSFTGHSLGAWKFEKLSKGNENLEDLEKKFRFSTRILAENFSIKYASFIVCSTKQERYEQYSHKLYNADPYSEKFKVIPPGINTKIFKIQEEPHDKLIEEYILRVFSNSPVNRQRLPFIIMSSRLDRKKNHISVVKAFIENQDLKQNANLIIVVRGVDNIDNFVKKNSEESEIVKEIVEVAKSELNRSIFFLNITDQKSLASLYRIGAKRGSVFVLPAIYEPFGLAIVEAAACGLKVVATMNGGPSEILSDGEGLLVDPEDTNDIALKLYISLTKFSNEKSLELANKYSWEKTGELYLRYIGEVLESVKHKENTSNIKTFTDEIEKDLNVFIKKIEKIKFI